MDRNEPRISILMLPFIAHGHISPFFELAKLLTIRNCNIFLCSSPVNLSSIKNRVSEKDYSASIQLVELHLPSSPDLPPHYHTTNGLPPHLFPTLRTAFESTSSNFSQILEKINPDLVIYDFNPPWAPEIAASHKIPAVYFQTSAAVAGCLALHPFTKPGEKFPFQEFVPKESHSPPSEAMLKDAITFIAGYKKSSDIVLIKSFRELEGTCIDYLSVLAGKIIIPVGPLVGDPIVKKEDAKTESIINWLDKKEKYSVVFLCFGSEYFLSDEELEEVANGLEISKVNFIWAVRFAEGGVKKELPLGFLERVGDRGMVVEGWAPQTAILGHPSTGGFVSHCGWSSLMESLKFGVPIIAMPMNVDQPVNAKLAAEVGVGIEIMRDKNGKFKTEAIAEVIRKVVVEESGEIVRRKAKAMREKGDEEIDRAVEELVKLCRKKKEE